MGRLFHTTPNVLHYRNKQRSGVMAPGHTFTIEPMICLGSNKPVAWPDKWTQVRRKCPVSPYLAAYQPLSSPLSNRPDKMTQVHRRTPFATPVVVGF